MDIVGANFVRPFVKFIVQQRRATTGRPYDHKYSSSINYQFVLLADKTGATLKSSIGFVIFSKCKQNFNISVLCYIIV